MGGGKRDRNNTWSDKQKERVAQEIRGIFL